MLSKQHRLPGHKIPLLLSKGQFLNTPLFNLKHKQNSSDSFLVGFIVSKKVLKKAVDRNSLKRTLRHLVKEVEKLVPTGRDYLFLLKSSAKESSRQQLSVEILKAFNQLKNLNEKNNLSSN